MAQATVTAAATTTGCRRIRKVTTTARISRGTPMYTLESRTVEGPLISSKAEGTRKDVGRATKPAPWSAPETRPGPRRRM